MLLISRIENFLKAKGYKLTKARKVLLNELAKHSGKSISVQELHSFLKDQNIDFSTIYRNMELLAKEDIVFTVRRDNGISAYELCFGEHHHHLVCNDCGRTTCIEYCPLDSINKLDLNGFVPKEHRFEIHGTCKECAEVKKCIY